MTAEEFGIIKKHPVLGYNICRPLKSVHEALPAIRWHHEKLDGSGYPKGLKGKKIPLFAQIVSISDVFDAISSHRQYRKSFSKKEAIDYIVSEGNKSFDTKLVDIFINNII